jgi:hypothetical protein
VFWEVPPEKLKFRLPPGYRVLESEHFVVLLDPEGRRIFLGSATAATPEVLLQAITRASSRKDTP